MKFSVAVPCIFRGVDFCEAIKSCASLGFDAAETYNWQNLDLQKVKSTLDDTGVTLISMCTTDFRMNEPEVRKVWLGGLRESCEAARILGVKKLISQVGQDTGLERSYQHEAIVNTLREARPILEEYGVTVMIEPLNLLVNHPGYYLPSSKEAFDIVNESENPFAKVVYDIYHQQITEGNIIPTVKENLDFIAHLHAAAHPGRIDLWLGENDYKFIFNAIDSMGYEGYCGLEYRPTIDPKESLLKIKELYG